MATPTVYLVGSDDLPTIPDFLGLGAVVVVAPDRNTLMRWRCDDEEDRDVPHDPQPARTGVVIDLEGRRILARGTPLPLSELEFRVLGVLVGRLGRARSFRELRELGWGDQPEVATDVEGLRALIQRIRRKLADASAPVLIEAVRGFGYRAVIEGVEGRTGHAARAAADG